MAIEVSCECGKRLRARDELAGRKARCPGCGKSIVVPMKVRADVEEDIFALKDEPAAAGLHGEADRNQDPDDRR